MPNQSARVKKLRPCGAVCQFRRQDETAAGRKECCDEQELQPGDAAVAADVCQYQRQSK